MGAKGNSTITLTIDDSSDETSNPVGTAELISTDVNFRRFFNLVQTMTLKIYNFIRIIYFIRLRKITYPYHQTVAEEVEIEAQ